MAYGPTRGNTFSLTLSQSIPVSTSFFQNTNIEADFRQPLSLGAGSLLAFHFYRFARRGKDPFIFYLGGDNQVRPVNYFSIIATEGWYSNLELRVRLVNVATTIIGLIGPVREALFFDVVRPKVKGYQAKFAVFDGFDQYGFPKARYADPIRSIGYGFQFFIFGFPVHLEFAKWLEQADFSRPFRIKSYDDFRARFWVRYDF